MNEGIRKEVDLAAPVARVWSFLTDREKLARWLMDSDFEAAKGASFSFTAEPSGGWDGRIDCHVVELEPERRLSYTWNANDIGAETLVTFELEPIKDGTRLVLTHTRFREALPGAEGRHAAGWFNVLKSLRGALSGPEEGYDWSAFQITSFLEAPVSEVYRSWTTVDGMRSFWADQVTCSRPDGTRRTQDEPYRTGDRIDLTFPTGRATRLEILNLEENRFVLFRFGEDYGWVRVTLSQEDGRTKLVLRQFGFPDDQASRRDIHAHARGWWIFNILNLKSVLGHGRDLRVRHPETAPALGAAYRPGSEPAPETPDWNAFDVYLQIDASPEQVLSRWRTAAGLESFFIARASFDDSSGRDRRSAAGSDAVCETGDRYHWSFIHDFRLEGRVLESTTERMAFTFGGGYAVEVSVRPSGSGTLLHLRQYGMRDEESERVHGWLNCRSCWIYFLTTLKSQTEHGIDLRDHDPETADSISVSYNQPA